ncbi:MAG: hypothetical protein LUI87_17060, partial [Lachnospiraceae bacterium]|nr:hypothetical protein [Lachnospiraceae bacterium]
MNWIVSVFFPVMIHLVISEGAAVLAGNVLDSASCTALSAVLTLPFGIWMYRQDEATRALHGAACCRSTAGGHYRCVFLYVLCTFLCLAGGCALNICWSGILNFLR